MTKPRTLHEAEVPHDCITLLAAWLGPIVLEHLDLLEPTWRVEKDAVVSMSSVIDLEGGATWRWWSGPTSS